MSQSEHSMIHNIIHIKKRHILYSTQPLTVFIIVVPLKKLLFINDGTRISLQLSTKHMI